MSLPQIELQTHKNKKGVRVLGCLTDHRSLGELDFSTLGTD